MSYRSQAVASTFLGTPLTLVLCGLYAQFGPASPATDYITAVILAVPLWSAVMVWGLWRPDPRVAWLGLGGALASAVTALLVARHMLGG